MGGRLPSGTEALAWGVTHAAVVPLARLGAGISASCDSRPTSSRACSSHTRRILDEAIGMYVRRAGFYRPSRGTSQLAKP